MRNAVKLVASPRSFLFKAASNADKLRWLESLKVISEATQKADKAAAAAAKPAPAARATPLVAAAPSEMKRQVGGLSLARERFSRAIATAGSTGQLRAKLGTGASSDGTGVSA